MQTKSKSASKCMSYFIRKWHAGAKQVSYWATLALRQYSVLFTVFVTSFDDTHTHTFLESQGLSRRPSSGPFSSMGGTWYENTAGGGTEAISTDSNTWRSHVMRFKATDRPVCPAPRERVRRTGLRPEDSSHWCEAPNQSSFCRHTKPHGSNPHQNTVKSVGFTDPADGLCHSFCFSILKWNDNSRYFTILNLISLSV